MQQSSNLKDYELLDMCDGEKLERWGKYILIRPDPQIVWNVKTKKELWNNAHARYVRSTTGGGHWEKLKPMNDNWIIGYRDIKFNLKTMGFKHTGLFPEQSVNWDYMYDKIKDSKRKDIKILNLFAYTGGASLACLLAGASVCHVDSSAGMISQAKENVKISNLEDRPIRYINDDVLKFVKREIKRGNFYDGIIMDPPSYGRGSKGEVWSIEKDLFELILESSKLLTKNALFFIVNTYTGGLSGNIIGNLLSLSIKKEGNISTNEIGLKMSNSNLVLPCGITTKWENNK
jgi:23S rRNA (cytosine1962-C5)-methyltransferase